ncbi:unnamed protein product [Nesidiocoris tenuis]|uniref:Integrase catalytic domain-containing protein n=1 Tax=Nesidiocoris tenuis TaxID=355587 RepID=A0A6H5H0U4_9HEMI|nr:unnamed protein product [Nesidiocoris tenuis]
MGELPKERVQPSRAFLNTGVDFCGPILVKTSNRRNSKAENAYVALFVCFATKAIHLELVSDLSTPAFLGALKRFFARRGKARKMFSDNGGNFVGAQRELHRLFLNASQSDEMKNYLSGENIEWSFIPPRSPNFGGLWEAGVKAFKYHFKRILGQAMLTFEEMTTVTAMIESCLNSRPLCPLSSDPNDLSPLTPGHFLIGDVLTAIPQPDILDSKVSTLKRWHRVEFMLQQFWSRWSKEYLSILQSRTKWKKEEENLQLGQLVLLKEEHLPPLKWPLGRIIDVHPGPDGSVRVATIKTSAGIYKRSISRICLLPIENFT